MIPDLALPLPVERLIPHRSVMRLVENLVSYEDGAGTVESTIGENTIFVNADGYLEEAVMVERLAQSFAALKGYSDLVRGKPIKKGYLVKINDLQVSGRAKPGGRLLVSIVNSGEIGEFTLGKGTVTCDGDRIASGDIVVWLPEGR